MAIYFVMDESGETAEVSAETAKLAEIAGAKLLSGAIKMVAIARSRNKTITQMKKYLGES